MRQRSPGQCEVPENIHNPMDGHWKLRGWGSQTANFQSKVQSLTGISVQTKKPSVGEVWIFSGTTQPPFLNK